MPVSSKTAQSSIMTLFFVMTLVSALLQVIQNRLVLNGLLLYFRILVSNVGIEPHNFPLVFLSQMRHQCLVPSPLAINLPLVNFCL